MIQVENLTKFYGNFQALRGISFEVQKGEILGFLGPNGAGKTTTMRILTGYMPPSGGRAVVAGYDTFEESLEARKHIGYMPETVPLYTDMTVADYLDFMGKLRHVSDRRNRIAEVMEKLDLTDRADTLIGKLSKGYRQRVGLAQAILHDPQVLILDEPTIGLDPRQIIEVRNLIRSLGGEHTVILSTHILPEVSQVANRVLIINKGQIVAEDTPENLTTRLKGGRLIQVEIGDKGVDATSVLREIPGVVKVEKIGDGKYSLTCDSAREVSPLVAQKIVSQGWPLVELKKVSLSLEDIFLHLTTEENTEEMEVQNA